LSNKLKVVIGILISYVILREVLLLTPAKLIYLPQTDLSPLSIKLTGVYTSGFLGFIKSDIVAPNILVSYTKSKFSVIVVSLQQILNC
jgi:hypothetical protein